MRPLPYLAFPHLIPCSSLPLLSGHIFPWLPVFPTHTRFHAVQQRAPPCVVALTARCEIGPSVYAQIAAATDSRKACMVFRPTPMHCGEVVDRRTSPDHAATFADLFVVQTLSCDPIDTASKSLSFHSRWPRGLPVNDQWIWPGWLTSRYVPMSILFSPDGWKGEAIGFKCNYHWQALQVTVVHPSVTEFRDYNYHNLGVHGYNMHTIPMLRERRRQQPGHRGKKRVAGVDGDGGWSSRSRANTLVGRLMLCSLLQVVYRVCCSLEHRRLEAGSLKKW